MINVGVYGDSFGAPTLGAPVSVAAQGFKHHWLTKLSEILNWNITNHSASGSSVYEAYRNFLRYNENYDLNIVIITISGRHNNTIDLSFEKNFRITSEHHLRDYIERNAHQVFTREDTELLRDLEGWYRINQNDYQYNISMTKLMHNDMKHLRPDTLFLRVNAELESIDNYPLFQVYADQSKLLGKRYDDSFLKAENPLLISGHFTPEIHELVADYVLDRINTGVWPEWNLPDDIKFNHSPEEYYNNY